MGYSTEVLKRARARLAEARADRESENRRNQELAYNRLPRLREIDRELKSTMSHAVAAVFSAGGDVQEAVRAVKERNLSLQRERQALIDAHFEEGFLDDTPICDRCGGTGYMGSAMCECLAELCRQEQKKELTILSAGQERFEQFRLDYYPDRVDGEYGVSIRLIMEKTFQKCKKYAMTFTESSDNLLFSGDTGLGKTFLSACIARTVADRGYSVVYESAIHLFEKLERARFRGTEADRQEAEKLTACDLLILDDLGTEVTNQFTVAALYTMLEDRLKARRPTIISTNLNTQDLSRRYSAQIASRLNGCFVRIPFLGDDIRVKKNWGY